MNQRFLLIATLPLLLSAAQGLGAPAGSLPFSGVTDVRFADLDRDGDLDIVAASTNLNQVNWFENLDGGTNWSTHVFASGLSGPWVIDLADFEGDGDLDMVVAERFANKISWYLFPSNGLVTVTTNFPAPSDVKAVYMNDEDRLMDVVATSFREDAISWFDSGGFQWFRRDISLSLNGARSLDVADIDKDGDLDVIAAGALDHVVAWYENIMDGTLWTQHLLSASMDSASGVLAADVDRDGDLDVVGTAALDSLLAWWSNPGNPLDAWPQFTLSTNLAGARSPVAGDYNRDGKVDLFAAGRTSSNITYWINLDGAGAAWDERIVDAGFADPRSIDLGDIDGDGDLDVLAASSDLGQISWWTNNPPPHPGNLSDSHSTVIEAGFPRVKGHAVGDFDCDGDLDIAAALNGTNQVVWWRNLDRAGTQWASSVIDTNFFRPTDLIAVDLDQDGGLDVVGTGNLDPGGIGWWRNVGGRGTHWVFTRIVSNRFFSSARSAKCADMDNDGNLDVVAASRLDDQIAWWQNADGTGTVWNKVVVQSNFQDAVDVALGDIDQDGHLDIAAAGSSNISYWISSLNGLGWATQYVVSTSFATPTSVSLVDMDTDGDLDLLFTASTTNAFTSYFRNDGGGAWVQRTIGLLNDGEQVDVADMDGDGDLDVVACAFNYISSLENLSWYENTGDHEPYTKHVVNTNFEGAFHITAADIDGDGDSDVVASAANNGGRPGDPDLQWWENTYSNRLAIEKESTPLVLSDTNFSYTLTVSNEHGIAATKVAVSDYFPPGVLWSSDSAGAGPPVSNLFTWVIGTLPAGESTSCVIQVSMNTNASPEIINLASVRGMVLGAPGTNDQDAAVTLALDTDEDGELNPFDDDDDNDFMPDEWENQYGLDPVDASDAAGDEDRDSMNNRDEYISDTIPTDSNSYFRVNMFNVTSNILISWSSSVARVYDVQSSTPAYPPAWSNIFENIPGSNQVISATDSNRSPESAYRIRVRLP